MFCPVSVCVCFIHYVYPFFPFYFPIRGCDITKLDFGSKQMILFIFIPVEPLRQKRRFSAQKSFCRTLGDKTKTTLNILFLYALIVSLTKHDTI